MNLGYLQSQRAMKTKQLRIEKGDGILVPHHIRSTDNVLFGKFYSTANGNTERLVRRYNMHDRLLSALKHVHETPAVNIDWQMVADTIKAAQP